MRSIFSLRCMPCFLLLWPLSLQAAPAQANQIAVFSVQCVLVENAQIAKSPLVKEGLFGRANHGHQIVYGKRSVLAVRTYIDNGAGVDSEVFKKATLEFDMPHEIADGGEATVNVLRSYYVEGASGWVADGRFYWSKDSFPRVHFRRDSGGLHATLKGEAEAAFADKVFRRPRKLIPVDVQCPVVQRKVIQLTPWAGRAGTSWYSFYLQE